MNRRSFMTALAGLPIVGWMLPKLAAEDVKLPMPAITSGYRLTVTLDGVLYELPRRGSRKGFFRNTTGRAIPAGTPLYWERRPLKALTL